MPIYVITYEVEAEEEHEALSYVHDHWDEPQEIRIEEEGD